MVYVVFNGVRKLVQQKSLLYVNSEQWGIRIWRRRKQVIETVFEIATEETTLEINVSNVAFNILRRRMQLGWSQRQLAQRADVSNSTISNLERGAAGEATGRTLRALAKALGCTTDDLMASPVPEVQHPSFNEAVFVAQLAAAMGDEPPDSAVRMARALRELFVLSGSADVTRFLELWAMTEKAKQKANRTKATEAEEIEDHEEEENGGYKSTNGENKTEC